MRSSKLRLRFQCLMAAAVLLAGSPDVAGQAVEAAEQAEQPPAIRSLAFSADGTLLAAAAGQPDKSGRLAVWDVETRQRRFIYQEPVGLAAAAFSPDGRTLAVGSFARSAKLLDAQTGEVLRTLDGHANHVRSVDWAPDGTTLATASHDRTIKLWNPDTGAATSTLEGHADTIFAIDVSPDGATLASGSGDRSARIWDLASGQMKHVFSDPTFITRHVKFSRDGDWLLLSGYDGSVRIVETGSARIWIRLRVGSGVECAELSPDNQTLAACEHDPVVKLFEVVLRLPDPAEAERINELILRWRDDDYQVREAASRELLRIGMLAAPLLREAMGSDSAEIRIRARRLRAELRASKPAALLEGHAANVNSLCISPDGSLLATGDNAGVVKLWDLRTQAELASFQWD